MKKILESKKFKLEIEASKLDQFADEYYMEEFSEFYQYIPYLKHLVISEGISADKIIDSLASPELVKEDMKHLSSLSYKYRCDSGYPTSFIMTEYLAKGKGLKVFGKRPTYYIDTVKKHVPVTFTTKEFIESVINEKSKREDGTKTLEKGKVLSLIRKK